VGQVDPCVKLDSLYKSGSPEKAFAFLQLNAQWPCGGDELKLLKAKILIENYRFSEAKYELSLIDYNKSSELLGRLKFLENVASNRTGANIKVSPQNAPKKNNLLLNINETCLIDTQFVLSEFPLTVLSQKAFLPRIEKNEWLETWLYRQNFIEVLPGSSFNDSIGALTVLLKRPFQNYERHYDIALIDLVRQKLITTWSSGNNASTMYPSINSQEIVFSSDMPGGHGGFDLWSVQWDGKEFGDVKNLGAKINSFADEVYPVKNGEKLFFASNREEVGFGGFDLFVIEGNGEPQNLGLPINSSSNDINPIINEGRLFSFSSNRDDLKFKLYEVNYADTTEVFAELFGRVEIEGANLAGNYLILSNPDSSIVKTIVLDKDGYFRINQLKGLENYSAFIEGFEVPENGGRMTLWNDRGDNVVDVKMDRFGFFVFELLKPEDYFLEKERNVDESILSVDIRGLFENSGESEFVIALENSEGEVIGLTRTDEKGHFIFESVIPDDRYTIRTEVKNTQGSIRILNEEGREIQVIHPQDQNGYVHLRLSDDDRVITITDESNRSVKISELETFNLPTVYFGTDQAKLTEKSKDRLSGFVKLVQQNSEINVEISGHTDSRGADDYNLKLSQERIESVLNFLIESGVSANRISGRGYGESKLKNHCSDGVSCSEQQHAENRRTELRIYQSSSQLDP